MQAGTKEDATDPPYTFQRITDVATDTLGLQGRGVAARRSGLSKCMFRPSDDATTLPFLVPANAMAAVELRHVAEILGIPGKPFSDPTTAKKATSLAGTIEAGLKRHGVAFNGVLGAPIYAYEVDGAGGSVFMDDANIPSLLSLPYLGYLSKEDPVYLATRNFILSEINPFYFSGTAGSGVGGPHVGEFYIWPMSILMRALTSDSDQEILTCLETLKKTHAGTYFMHESFFMNNPSEFTRPWFAWANSLFGELLLVLARERPHLIFNSTQPLSL
jgi:meiotically up-regulated gene 157 (Mug157) protein